MKKILYIFISFLILLGCKKDLTSLNNDPKNPSTVRSGALFTNAQKTLARTMSSASVNLNIFRLIEQYWTETTYTDESNYDLQTRQIPRGVWNTMYRDVLRDFQETRSLIPNDVLNPATQAADGPRQKNELAIVDIMEVYTWYYLTTTYGDIPYTEALNINKPFPKYDSQASIFADLLKRLDADLAALDPTAASFTSEDIIYHGDPIKWKKFAATFKMKIGITLADVDPSTSKAVVTSAIATGVFTSNADNAQFRFLTEPPNTNPVWEDLVQSGRKDFVIANTLIDTMKFLKDPRIPYFFTSDATSDTTYSGGIVGESNNFQAFSKPSAKLTAADFPVVLLDYSETAFMLAEAVERGYGIAGTAQQHYDDAITSSILYWGGTMDEAASYLRKPNVNYTSAGTYKQKVGLQKWLALYNRGFDAWIETRRLDNPILKEPASAVSEFPVRFTYSVDEQNINTTNYNAAAAAIGGDKVTTKLYWDKF